MRQTRTRTGLKTSALFLLLLAAVLSAAPATATPVRDARRMINGHAVDLTPLMKWYTNHHGTRPLTAWVHVTGVVVATNAWGWLVQGQAEIAPHSDAEESSSAAAKNGQAKLLLRNPPVQERAEFDRLRAQLKQLESQRSQVANQQTEAKSRADALNKEQAGYRRAGYRSRVVTAEARQVRLVQNQSKAELKPLDQQIAELKRKLAPYPSVDHYEVDCFALDANQEYQGMRLLDHGVIMQ